MKLDGITRFRIAKIWLERGRPGKLEDFIKQVCEAKDIEYVKEKK